MKNLWCFFFIYQVSGLMLASHTSIRHLFSKCLSQYEKLRKKQAFLDNYRKFPMFAVSSPLLPKITSALVSQCVNLNFYPLTYRFMALIQSDEFFFVCVEVISVSLLYHQKLLAEAVRGKSDTQVAMNKQLGSSVILWECLALFYLGSKNLRPKHVTPDMHA